jgi:hypothetical protein
VRPASLSLGAITPRKRRRPGKVAARVTRLVRERRRLIALKDDIRTAYEADAAALLAEYRRHATRIDAQLGRLDHGLMPQPEPSSTMEEENAD